MLKFYTPTFIIEPLNMAKAKSIEPNIADLANGWLKSYGLDYKLEQEEINSEIAKALADYASKSGGKGINRPDVKLLLRVTNFFQLSLGTI